MSIVDRWEKIALNKVLVQRLLLPYGMRMINAHPVKGGAENTSFVIVAEEGRYVLRVYKLGDKNSAQIERELDFMSFMNERNIPTPKIILNNKGKKISVYKKDGKTWKYILMEFMPGRHLKGVDYDLIPELAYYQAALHTASKKFARQYQAPARLVKELSMEFVHKHWVPRNFIKEMLDNFKKETGYATEKRIDKSEFWFSVQAIIEEIRKDFKDRLGEIKKASFGLVHLDYDSDNILVMGNKVSGIIDFDDLAYRPFVADLANTLWWWTWENRNKNPQKIMQKYLVEYSKSRGLNKSELSLLIPFMRLRNIAVGIFINTAITKGISFAKAKEVIAFDTTIKDLK